jgi:hypothetical protein
MRWMPRRPVDQLIARLFDEAGGTDLPDYDARDRRRLDVR